MPAKFITPPINIWGLTNSGVGEQLLLESVNTSTIAPVARSHGDIVIPDTSNTTLPAQFPTAPGPIGGGVVTTTTTPSFQAMGLVSITGDSTVTSATVPVGSACYVAVAGLARANFGANAAASANLAIITSATAGLCGSTALATTAANIGAIVGVTLEAKDSSSGARALLRYA